MGKKTKVRKTKFRKKKVGKRKTRKNTRRYRRRKFIFIGGTNPGDAPTAVAPIEVVPPVAANDAAAAPIVAVSPVDAANAAAAANSGNNKSMFSMPSLKIPSLGSKNPSKPSKPSKFGIAATLLSNNVSNANKAAALTDLAVHHNKTASFLANRIAKNSGMGKAEIDAMNLALGSAKGNTELGNTAKAMFKAHESGDIHGLTSLGLSALQNNKGLVEGLAQHASKSMNKRDADLLNVALKLAQEHPEKAQALVKAHKEGKMEDVESIALDLAHGNQGLAAKLVATTPLNLQLNPNNASIVSQTNSFVRNKQKATPQTSNIIEDSDKLKACNTHYTLKYFPHCIDNYSGDDIGKCSTHYLLQYVPYCVGKYGKK